MENRSSSSGADALASGGLAGAIDGPPLSPPPPPLPPPPPVEESPDANAVPGLEDAAGGSRDMMDVDVPPSVGEKEEEEEEEVAVVVVSSVAPASPPPPPPAPSGTPPPPPDRTMTTPPPPSSRPRANATPTHSPSTTTTTTPHHHHHHHHQQQTPRDIRQILQAAGSIRTGFPSHGSVPPSPVVKPGALHEFEVSDPTSPATRRRSSATAGIAGLEELRNRIDAEKCSNRNGFKSINGDAGPLDQLIQATTGAGGYVDGFGELLSDQRAHVIDAFVRLDFDDGHVFYVRNSSVVFGRAEGASSNSFQQLGPDGSTVIGSNPFGGFDPTTTPGAMSMKREKKKRRKKKGDASTGTPKNKSTTSGASSAGYPDSSRRNSAFAHRQNFPMFRDGSATNFSFPFFPAPQSQRVDEVPIIHLPLATSDAEAAAAPPKKNISRKHAVLNYNFAKRRFELKITGKNGAFVEDEFVHCDTTWVVGPNGMRVQIGGVGFKVVVPVVPGGGFGVPSKGGGGKGGKGKMSTSFTDEHGNEVQTDFSDEDDDDDEDGDEEMEQVDGSGGGSDESMEEASDESGDEGDEDEDGEDVEDDEEAQEGDVENSEGESEEEEESDEEAEATPPPPPPPPEPVKVEKKRGRGRPRKDEAEIARQELEKARAKEKVREKERRHKEKLEATKRAKEVEREKERERKRQEEIKQKEERARQKERARREKEQQKEQKKLHLPQKEEPKKATKLYLPTPAAAKKEADKSLALQAKKGPGRPPKPKSSPPPPPPPPPPQPQQNASMPPPPPPPLSMSMSSAPALVPPSMPELEQAFSPSNPLMAVAAFNATTPAIDPALYNSAPSYTPAPAQRRVSPQGTNKPAREPKPKKEKPPVRKRTPSPEILESDYPPEALLKPAASYVILIHEAITKSEETALTLPQIYKAIERKYPYFKLRVTTNGWQSSVRHNLGAHKAFCKVTRSGKGWMWGINEGVSIEKEKNKANIAASRPPAYQPPPPQQPGGVSYQNGNGGYHQQQPNGYPVHNIGVPMYVDQNHASAGRGPVYQQQQLAPPMPQYQVSPQQSARIPPMPMAYQPPMQTASATAPPVTASIGQTNKQPSHQFPNAPIPPPAGNNPAAQQQPKQNGSPPEMIAAIQGLQKQLALLASQNQGSAAGPSAPGSVSPAILAQAQQLLAGLMSGKHTGRGASGNTDLVKQLTKAIQQGAGRNGAATAPVKSAPVVLPPAPPAAPSAATKRATPTPMPAPAPAPAPAQVTAGMQPGPSPRSGSAVDFKNLPPEQKKKLYRALLLAKEKKEREKEGLREAVSGSPSGTKRPLDDGGAEPVAKKVDVGGVGGSGSTA